MPNIAAMFKQEITRLAKREIKDTDRAVKRVAWTTRSEIAALKRKVMEIEKKLVRIDKHVARVPTVTPADGNFRFIAKGFRAHRQRLDLSMPEMARLLDVSPQSIYNWESGHAKPRARLLPRIAAVRAMGKREADRHLASMATTPRARK